MPLNAFGWSNEEDELLVELVQPHSHLYNIQDPSRKNILARESTWQEIAQNLSKPVEECKKRWRGVRDGYMRSKRLGTVHKTKTSLNEKLQFLDEAVDGNEEEDSMDTKQGLTNLIVTDQQNVITDNGEYYEITVVDEPQHQKQPKLIKTQKPLLIKAPKPPDDVPKKMRKNTGGRKRTIVLPSVNAPPIKILPKPMTLHGPQLVQYLDDTNRTAPEQRTEIIDKLIERILKENTNEVDVFFRSMAASVKKLQPNLIPKVKMEVCNVIAKYEMLSYEKTGQTPNSIQK